VHEPVLQVTELVAPSANAGGTTPGTFSASPLTTVQGNDTIFYELVITNAGANWTNTTAYDLFVSNSLPANLVNPQVYAVTNASLVGNVYSNGVAQPFGLLSNSLFGINPANNVLTNVPGAELDMEPTSAIIVVVSAQLAPGIPVGTTLLDTNTIQWGSLPGINTNESGYVASGNERLGVSTPLPAPGVSNYFAYLALNGPDDYAAAAPVVSASTITVNPVFVKVFSGTDHSASGLTPTNVVIGEHVSYTLTLTVPQGVTTGDTITDTLPQGLGFVGVTNVTWSAGVSNSNPITIATNQDSVVVGGGNNKIVTFSLGNVTNLNTSDVGANGLAITIQTVVLDTNVNRAGVAFTNIAQFASAQYTSGISTSAIVSIMEPVLQVGELVATNLAGAPGVYGRSVSGLPPGAGIYYQITITNAGAAYTNTTAYDLYVSNSLPAGLLNPAVISVTAYTNIGNVYSNGLPQTSTLSPTLFGINPANNVLTNVPNVELDLEPTSSIVVVVSAQLSLTIGSAAVLVDTNTIEWASLPGTKTNESAYTSFGNERLGVSAPLPGAGGSNFFVTTLSGPDDYAAAAAAAATVVAWAPCAIGHYTWLDINGDGLQDAGDPALPGVPVALYQSNVLAQSSLQITNTLTSASGFYQFTNLPPGTYEVSFTPPAGGYTASSQLVGSNTNLNSAPSQATGLTYFFTMQSGQTNFSLNAGFVPNPSAVSMVLLGADVYQGNVWVTWETFDESGLLGFDLTRSTSGGPSYDVTPNYVLAVGLDLGHTYTVPDARATLPGTYTYVLSGYYGSGSFEQLASVTVQLAAPQVTGPALTITGMQITGGSAVLTWTGGQAPYVVEQAASLGAGAIWQSVGSAQTGTQIVLPLTNQAGFFRVSSGGN
jgi:fimbrial isopeptide formation D2 family protein